MSVKRAQLVDLVQAEAHRIEDTQRALVLARLRPEPHAGELVRAAQFDFIGRLIDHIWRHKPTLDYLKTTPVPPASAMTDARPVPARITDAVARAAASPATAAMVQRGELVDVRAPAEDDDEGDQDDAADDHP